MLLYIIVVDTCKYFHELETAEHGLFSNKAFIV